MTNETIRPPTPAEIEYAKLMAVRQLIPVIRQNNHLALEEMLYRLTTSFKGRLRTGPDDTATPEEQAQALLAAVLMAGISYQEPTPQPAPGQFAVVDVETHEVITSFATEQEAIDYVDAMIKVDDQRTLSMVAVSVKEHDPEAGQVKVDPSLKKFFPGKSGVET